MCVYEIIWVFEYKWHTDFKNVIFEKIPLPLSEVAEVKIHRN